MNEVYTITSEKGDEYKLQFSTDRSGIIAENLLDLLNSNDIEVVEIGLARFSPTIRRMRISEKRT